MASKYGEIMARKDFLPYKMGYLTDWMVKKAKEELKEDERNHKAALEKFRRLIAEDTGLNCWTDDAYLLQYLRARKFNVKNALERLQHFFTVKKNFPDVYPENLDLDTLKRMFGTGVAGSLPYRDENGCVIIIFKMLKWDPDVYPFSSILSLMTAIIMATVEDPASQVCGIQLIVDTQDITLQHMKAFTPRYCKLLSYALRNTIPVRFKGVHVINESWFFTYIYGILKLFLSEKIKNRFYFHGSDSKHLQKYISKEILPAEYGGDNLHYDAKEWSEKEMESYYDRYAELHHKGYC